MSLSRLALSSAKTATLAGAVLIALASPVFGATAAIADTGSSTVSPSPTGVDDHLWDK